MKYYHLFCNTIKFENETLKYLMSPDGLELSEQIQLFYSRFLEAYLYKSSPIPTFNPLKKAKLKFGKKSKDIYRLIGKLGRHFIISPKFKSILEDYNLSGHVCFNGVTLKGENHATFDYYYLSFYESMWDKIVIEKCLFYEDEEHLEKFNCKDYKFTNLEEYNVVSKKINLMPKILNIKDIDKYDLFAFFNYSEFLSFYISEKLYNRIKHEKIKGLDISELTEFEITN